MTLLEFLAASAWTWIVASHILVLGSECWFRISAEYSNSFLLVSWSSEFLGHSIR